MLTFAQNVCIARFTHRRLDSALTEIIWHGAELSIAARLLAAQSAGHDAPTACLGTLEKQTNKQNKQENHANQKSKEAGVFYKG